MKQANRPYVMAVRAARMLETRDRILDSAIELYVKRGIDEFKLDQVAQEAGVTVRTVLRIHGSREKLLFNAVDKLARSGVPLKPTAPGDVAAAVTAIFDLYEMIGGLILQWLADECRRPGLKKILDDGRADHIKWVQVAFAPQLRACSKSQRRRLLNALVVATDVYSWNKLRRDVGLTRPEAEAVVRFIVEAVVRGDVSHGKGPVAKLVGRRKSST